MTTRFFAGVCAGLTLMSAGLVLLYGLFLRKALLTSLAELAPGFTSVTNLVLSGSWSTGIPLVLLAATVLCSVALARKEWLQLAMLAFLALFAIGVVGTTAWGVSLPMTEEDTQIVH